MREENVGFGTRIEVFGSYAPDDEILIRTDVRNASKPFPGQSIDNDDPTSKTPPPRRGPAAVRRRCQVSLNVPKGSTLLVELGSQPSDKDGRTPSQRFVMMTPIPVDRDAKPPAANGKH
jgi:hypothetical protein